MTADEKTAALAKLRAENTAARPALLVTYLDALNTYREAQANIDANGAIVFHPRTGAPIENPYLAVRDRAARVLVAAKLRSEF
jgi:phage terminase small subunit